ncbi:hypothetical protein RMSM_06737 [Rhodopirellula maiorica SM1]|uniref:Uncharacterized protein n=1 Tax=Rhodopirellula maiorica SM1 TaxID=1265738 RepID=M5RA19_9BACT|nr:DUF5682 family protein [Rhodopirellula maiorica]EMI16333.1 hypothetical protein RMSM_06737 [Rhodopirellula maiorica SM1]
MPKRDPAPDDQPLIDRLCDTTADVVYFPVRHHSPACAMLVAQLIDSLKPTAVLIEGPSDYNAHLDELRLEHQLPIAIYSYFRAGVPAKKDQAETELSHQGVYYPFCEYSPEWVAIEHANRIDTEVRFIDLPWSESAGDERASHRYADAELRRGRYVNALCERLQVEDFDDLWDRLIESHRTLDITDYLRRVHSLCWNIRTWEPSVSVSDRRREAFMAKQIALTSKRTGGKTLVVTGGFHSSALLARNEGYTCAGIDDPPASDASQAAIAAIIDRGIALTTYSYERLDNLTGYNAGMPSPGFYHHAWLQRNQGQPFDHQPLLTGLVNSLRDRKQTLSTADLIAVETSARALAALRGRQHVWRRDLIDAVTSSLIKDELEYDCESPFIDAVHAVLRGDQRGRLASGTRIPPLVREIQQQIETLGLELTRRSESIELDLLDAEDVQKSRLLHQLSVLEIKGIRHDGGTDFLARHELERLWEKWKRRWTPEFESSCIEASRYGITIAEAVAARLTEETHHHQRDAAMAAELLVKASQCGAESLSKSLLESLERLIASEPRFAAVAQTLGHLLFLYCFDEAFGTTRLPQLQRLVCQSFARSLWLLESLGKQTPADGSILRSMQAMLETYRRVGDVLELDENEFASVMARIQADAHKPPAVRGAAAGTLWTIGRASPDRVLEDLMFFANPDHLGDFLNGLFTLAREVAQRHPPLVRSIDQVLLRFGGDEFQTALPSLRLAFTSFTPREKHHMLSTLFDSLGLKSSKPLIHLPADEATAAESLAIEDRLFESIAKYGLEQIDERL